MNSDDLLYRLGLERRRWRQEVREAKRQRNAHMETCRYLRIRLADMPADEAQKEISHEG